MSKKLSVLLLILLFFFDGMAQKSKKEEYVVTVANDTLHGEVHRGLNPESVSFKASGGTGSRKYTAREIKAYQTGNGRVYVAKKFGLPAEGSKTIFFQALVTGPVSLFKYSDIFLVNKKDSVQIQVAKIEEENIVNGQTVMRTSYSNSGALTYLLSDCAAQPATNNIKSFTERNLTKLVVAYNECSSGGYTEFGRDKAWTKVNIGVGAGILASAIDFSANTTSFPFLTEAKFTESVAPAFITSFVVSSPRINERLFIQADLLFSMNKHTASYLKEHAQLPEKYDATIEMKSVILPLSFGYVITEGKIRTNIQLGASLQWNLQSEVSYWKESEVENTIHTYFKGPFAMEKVHYGLWGGLEASKKISNKTDGFLALRSGITENVFSADAFSKKHLFAKLTTLSILAGVKF